MQMRPEVQLAAMIKAMSDVIIPALPQGNMLAVEQANLVVGMLNLMQTQLPVQFRFDRDELQRLVEAAQQLKAVGTEDRVTAAGLEQVAVPCARATEVLERCKAGPDELYAAILQLRGALCALVDASATSADIGARECIESILLAMSKEQLLRDRALMKPQRWEPDPAAVPDIDTLVGR
ncbi:hypothetical protein M622_13505 [Thauera terpenica 58Eu]|uniref:Uncharacterized protein n=1 Tax=Thauera terpenica 58Eu TaxID=1348657 RepID=T0ATS4_9RHOO|nr:hypothetical protein [Thauera terpenica]EPZ16239.1 hypothetical protein M622_13505 [Thauera terpenica 58Eu]